MIKFGKFKPVVVSCAVLVLITAIVSFCIAGIPNANDKVVTSSDATDSSSSFEQGSDVDSSPSDASSNISSKPSTSSEATSSTKKKTTVVYNKFDPTLHSEIFVEKIEINKNPTKTAYNIGETIDLSGAQIIGYFSDGSKLDVTAYVQIHYDMISAVGKKLRIQVEFTDYSETINIVTTHFYVEGLNPTIALSNDNLTLAIGTSQQLSVTTSAVNWPITWHTTDESVVQIDENGNITAIGEGTANVYAEITYRNGSAISSYCVITIAAQ